jgi:hypothetical protein
MNATLGRRRHGSALILAAIVSLAGVSYAAIGATNGGWAPPRVEDGAPEWNELYWKYMAKGTVGDCPSCHAEASTAPETYRWLAKQQYMVGNPPYLVDPRASIFSWLGGDMPPEGPSRYVRAEKDFAAWADARARLSPR